VTGIIPLSSEGEMCDGVLWPCAQRSSAQLQEIKWCAIRRFVSSFFAYVREPWRIALFIHSQSLSCVIHSSMACSRFKVQTVSCEIYAQETESWKWSNDDFIQKKIFFSQKTFLKNRLFFLLSKILCQLWK